MFVRVIIASIDKEGDMNVLSASLDLPYIRRGM